MKQKTIHLSAQSYRVAGDGRVQCLVEAPYRPGHEDLRDYVPNFTWVNSTRELQWQHLPFPRLAWHNRRLRRLRLRTAENREDPRPQKR